MYDHDTLHMALLGGVSVVAIVLLVIYFRRDTAGQDNGWFWGLIASIIESLFDD